MDAFLENAQRILDVASHVLDVAHGGEGGSQEDFALLIRPDGGLHFIMGSPVSLDGAFACDEARAAYHVSRSSAGVRVEGRTFGKSCVVNSCVVAESHPMRQLLRDQVLYCTAGPLLSAGSTASGV